MQLWIGFDSLAGTPRLGPQHALTEVARIISRTCIKDRKFLNENLRSIWLQFVKTIPGLPVELIEQIKFSWTFDGTLH